MKIKIILIGVCLVGLISACDLFGSDKFNSHQIDGYWTSSYVVTLPGYTNQFVYHTFLTMHYPHIQACSEKRDVDSTYWQLKENLKIAHTEGNFYKVEKINNIPVKGRNLIYKFKKDTTLEAIEITPKSSSAKNSLGEAIVALLYKKNYPPGTTYSECRSNAIVVDTLF